MNTQPLVSVVITTLNRRNLLLDTLRSVIAQDYIKLEIIVVDDGSNQPSLTESEISEMGINYIYGPNVGQSESRNIGIKASKGEYIAFVDDDDLWEPHKITTQIKLMSIDKTMWCFCDCDHFINDLDNVVTINSQLHTPYDGFVFYKLLRNNFIASPTVIIHREALLGSGGLFLSNRNARYGEDWFMWLKISSKYPISYCPRILAHYRIHPNSMLANANFSKLELSHHIGIAWVFDTIDSKYSHSRRQALCWDYQRLSAIAASFHRPKYAFKFAIKSLYIKPYSYVAWLYLINATMPKLKQAIPVSITKLLRKRLK